MAILKNIYPLLLLLLLASCEETFNPDMPHAPVLCMNALVSAGEPIHVDITKSRLYTENFDMSVVKDAFINIYANDELQDDTFLPQEGDAISIVARSSSVGTTEAEVIVPHAVPINAFTWNAYDIKCWKRGNKEEYDIQFNLQVKLTISDPLEENFYRFTFSNPYSKDISEEENFGSSHPPYYLTLGELQYDMEPIFSEHIGIFESIMGGDAYGFTFFTDRQFAGKSYTLNLTFSKCTFLGTLDEMPDCQCSFMLNTISPSYYNWANYLWQQSNGTIVEFGNIGFGDPIWGYSNCSSGAGVVAAQSVSEISINFADFMKETINNSTF